VPRATAAAAAALHPPIAGALLGPQQRADTANAKILDWIADTGQGASAVENYSFLEMIEACIKAGPTFRPKKRKHFRAGGSVFTAVIADKRSRKVKMLLDLDKFGNVLANDAARSTKRSAVQSCASTIRGVFFVRSTDATGQRKDARFIADDCIAAIESYPEDFFFMVVLDGASACLAAFPFIRARFPRVLTLRCMGHAWNLLHGELAKLWKVEIGIVFGIIRFVTQKEKILDLFEATERPKKLLGDVATRFVRTLECVSRCFTDKAVLTAFFMEDLPRHFDAQRAWQH